MVSFSSQVVIFSQSGQSTSEDIKHKDLKRDLEAREREKGDKEKKSTSSSRSSEPKRARGEIPAAALDHDEPLDQVAVDGNWLKLLNNTQESDVSSGDDDSDDEAELLAELTRIKKERAQEKAIEVAYFLLIHFKTRIPPCQEAQRKEQEERIRTDNILHGNPLLTPQTNASSDFTVKRR